MTADEKYSLLNRDNWKQLIQILSSQKEQIFSPFFWAYLKSTLNFEHFQKKMTLITDVFPKLRKSRLREPFRNQHGKRAQTLLHSGRQQLYHIYWSMWRRMSWKMALLALWKILGLFVTTLTADDKYSLLNRDNLTQPIQILVPQKQKTFSQFLSAFLKTIWNFKHFQTKDDSHSRCISEVTHSEKGD